MAADALHEIARILTSQACRSNLLEAVSKMRTEHQLLVQKEEQEKPKDRRLRLARRAAQSSDSGMRAQIPLILKMMSELFSSCTPL